MPEGINRLLTEQICELLFTASRDADENLAREGIPATRIHMVGNVMIDTLVRMLPKAGDSLPRSLPERFVLVTLHRPSNVDDRGRLAEMLSALSDISSGTPVLFPIHPRTREHLASLGINGADHRGIQLLEPLPYLKFLGLQRRAALVVTDSGGIQEETTFLGIPCLTVRENTERPVTVDVGTNVVVGRDPTRLRAEMNRILAGDRKQGRIPALWDGQAANRIARIVVDRL